MYSYLFGNNMQRWKHESKELEEHKEREKEREQEENENDRTNNKKCRQAPDRLRERERQ